jgi:hypothetical protein
VTRIDSAPGQKDTTPFPGIDDGPLGVPVTPPPEVLDALDHAARVMFELDRKNITLTFESAGAGSLRVMLHRPGAPGRELSHRALLSLLDGDASSAGRLG